MKVIYKENGLSIIKAFLYAELTESEIASETAFNPTLFFEPSVAADDLEINELILKVRLLKKNPHLFNSAKTLKSLQEMLDWVFRNNALNKEKVILKALHQCLAKGASYIFEGISKESRQLIIWAKGVQSEVRLSTYKIKFKLLPNTEQVFYVKYSLKHKTDDLILSPWLKIYPEYTFVLLLPGKTILGNRFTQKELGIYTNNLTLLSKKIAQANLLTYPQRSKMISNHSQYVQETQAFGLQYNYTKSVNYVDFYNKITRGEILL